MTREKIYQTALEQIESHLCANDFRAGVSAMQIIASKALAAAERLPHEPRGECICPTCGLRHGGSNVDGGF